MKELTNQDIYQLDKKIIYARKKPIVIEAFQYQGFVIDIPWIDIEIHHKDSECCYIKTLEGTMLCMIGDYIIKGIKGEFYPIKEDIFLESYELVEGEV